MTTLAEQYGYARLGYDAYRIANQPDFWQLPEFDQLPLRIRNAWISAADSVKDAVLTDLRAHMATM